MAFDTDHGAFSLHDADRDADRDDRELADDDGPVGDAPATVSTPIPRPRPNSRCLDSALIHQALQAVRRRRRLASAP